MPPILVCNDKNRSIHLHLTVGTLDWIVKIGPHGSQEIPSLAHYHVLQPHAHRLHLNILDEEGKVYEEPPPVQRPSAFRPKPSRLRVDPPLKIGAPAESMEHDEATFALEALHHMAPETFVPPAPPDHTQKQSSTNLAHKTRAQLRQICLERGLPATGTQKELLARLTE